MKQHSARSCQAKNPSTCPYHGSSTTAAISRGDINAFIEAKAVEQGKTSVDTMSSFFGTSNNPEIFVSPLTVQIDGKVYDKESLSNIGISNDQIVDILERPSENSGTLPTEQQKTLRLKSAILFNEFYSTIHKMDRKEFKAFTSRRAQRKYYEEGVAKVSLIVDSLEGLSKRSARAEGVIVPTPLQRGDIYKVEEPGIKVYPAGSITELTYYNDAKNDLQHAIKGLEAFDKNGEYTRRSRFNV